MHQIRNKKVMNTITLAEYRNIIAMQKLLIDLKNVKPVKTGEAQKIVLATRLRMKRAIEQKEGDVYTHFHVRMQEYRDVSLNLHKIWKYLPSNKDKR